MAEQAGPPVDGFVALLDGMQAGLDPEILKESAYSRGINVSCRGGLLRSRPGFVHDLELPAGAFQGMASWALHSGARLVLVIGGSVCVVRADDSSLQVFSGLLSATAQCYLCQAERFMVIQDGSSTPVVLQENGGVVEVRPQAHTIPVGTAMTFAHGRLHLTPKYVPGGAENGQPYVVSGDIFNPQNPASCLEFTETDYLSEGGAHSLPMEMGYVRAFAPLRNAPTGTGYGGTVVFAERGVSAFDFSVPRDEWKSTALSQVLFFGPGTKSPWSVIPVNGTLLYRAVDGLRLLSYSVTSAQSTGDILSMVPQSTEVSPYMTRDDRDYLPFVSAAVSDNRVFMTVGGVNERWFRGLLVYDTARVSSIAATQAEGAYDGLWQVEGVNIGGVASCVRNGEETLYFYGSDGWLWRLDPEAEDDNGTAVRCRLRTRALMHDTASLKRLKAASVWLRGLSRDASVSVYYRPTGYPLWAELGVRAVKVGTGSLQQRRRNLSFNLDIGSAPSDPASGEALYLGQGFEFTLEFTGPLVVSMFRCEGILVAEPAGDPCSETTGAAVAAGTAGVEIGDFL